MNLPEIFKNKIDTEIRNSQNIFYSKNERSDDFLTKLPVAVLIETKEAIIRTKIVGKTANYLVTDKSEIINLSDCLSIKKE